MLSGRSPLTTGLRAGLAGLAGLTLIALVALTADLRGWRDARADDDAFDAVLLHTRTLAGGIVQAESGERGFLLTGREAYLQPLADARVQVPEQAAGLVQEARHFPTLEATAQALAGASLLRLRMLESQVIAARGPGGAAAAAALIEQGDGRRAMAAVHQLAALMHQRIDAAEGRKPIWRIVQVAAGRGKPCHPGGGGCVPVARRRPAGQDARRTAGPRETGCADGKCGRRYRHLQPDAALRARQPAVRRPAARSSRRGRPRCPAYLVAASDGPAGAGTRLHGGARRRAAR